MGCCGNNGKTNQYKYCKDCQCKDPSAKPAPGCKKKGRCMAISLKGDGYCDDENNNCGCNWDGGDCCGYNGKKDQRKYCKACKCLDPTYVDNGCRGFCGAESFQGDGYCDDNNNNCACKYDGGDCCGKSGKSAQFSYCQACACKDPKRQATPLAGQTCTGTCRSGGKFRGDGYCDDGNNNCGCEYDGGDCCGASGKSNQFQYCTTCKCVDPKKAGAKCDGKGCGAGGSYKGDGYCDDGNNNCACEYDGGDCCGKKIKANTNTALLVLVRIQAWLESLAQECAVQEAHSKAMATVMTATTTVDANTMAVIAVEAPAKRIKKYTVYSASV